MTSTNWARVIVTTLALSVVLEGCAAAKHAKSKASNGIGGSLGETSSQVTLNETGSSLLYPLFSGQWSTAYQKVAPNVAIAATSTGSGTGIAQAIAGTVQIGASDAYLADAQMKVYTGMLNIPLAVSAQGVMYNLPGVKSPLKLTGDILAKIYEGKIQYWDDSAITALNSHVILPHRSIIPVRRSDGSGGTFLFTQFLSETNSDWHNSAAYGTTVYWPPLGTEVGAKGNDGVVTALANNPYSIGYVGISWLEVATGKGLRSAALQNKDGNFVLPTEENIEAAANSVASVPADERVSLTCLTGDRSYPLVNFEYAIVNKDQSGDTATALKRFLSWAIDPAGGNSRKYMAPVHFLPLPSVVESQSKAQIDQIGS